MWKLPVLYVSVSVLLILFLSEMMVLGGMRLANASGYPDPFAPYEAAMPGRSIDSAALFPCRFREMRLVRDMTGYCQLHSDNDTLLVTFTVQFDRFRRLSYRGGNFQFGDLVNRWGYPDGIETIATRNGVLVFHARWNSGVYAIINPVQLSMRLNYFAPVYYLAIEGEQSPISGSV